MELLEHKISLTCSTATIVRWFGIFGETEIREPLGGKRKFANLIPSRGNAHILHYRPRFRCKYWEN